MTDTSSVLNTLAHWGRVTHICINKLTIISSDNGLSPGRRQAIIWTNAEILLIGPSGTNFSENFIGIQTFSFKKMHLKMSSAKWGLFRLGLNELMQYIVSSFVIIVLGTGLNEAAWMRWHKMEGEPHKNTGPFQNPLQTLLAICDDALNSFK